MENAEQIKGKHIYSVIKQLQADKTILTMHLLGKNFERLTLITGVRTQHGVPYFVLDHPKGFQKAVANLETWRIYFECIGKDKILYVFRTYGGKIEQNEIWINFPQHIERRQRRRHFRLKAPVGTKLFMHSQTRPRELTVVNISQGGILGALASTASGTVEGPLFRVGQIVNNMELVFPTRNGEQQLLIRKALVRRVDQSPGGSDILCGFEFTHLNKDDKKRLTDLIYSYQRDLLQKGLRVYE